MNDRQKEKELTIEELFDEIEDIVEELEEPDVTLDDSFRLYQQGVEKLRACTALLDTVEKKMQVIQENGELTEF